MIKIVIKNQINHYEPEKSFKCKNCGKNIIFYAQCPTICINCKTILPYMEQILLYPSSLIAFHTGDLVNVRSFYNNNFVTNL